jgi:TonB-dependent Receptor Plug Domain
MARAPAFPHRSLHFDGGPDNSRERSIVCKRRWRETQVVSMAVRRFSQAVVIGIGLHPVLGLAQTTQSTPPPEAPTFKINVIETTPLPGLDLRLEQIPAPVQTAVSADIEASGALDLSDFLNRRLNGVFINEMQNNPFQPDLNYRGYTASPLLGTPQGLSVYMDGVRLNQPFGDIVSWDLIPRMAIASTTLMPGSNPLFGLNTLGGALSIQTKDGRSNPGTLVQATYGSDLRRAIEFEHGGSRAGGLNWYLAGSLFAEDGWRDDSPSRVAQIFGKLGWYQPKSETALSVGYANNSLNGNGLQELRFLDRDFASVYTRPDINDNRATSLNLTTRREFHTSLTLAGNVYYRDIRNRTFNRDINEDSLDQAIYQPSAAEQRALAAAGYTGFPTSGATADNTPFPSWRCIGNVLLNDEPGEKCNGLLNRGETVQDNYGMSGQLTWRDWLTKRNALTIGADTMAAARHSSSPLNSATSIPTAASPP